MNVRDHTSARDTENLSGKSGRDCRVSEQALNPNLQIENRLKYTVMDQGIRINDNLAHNRQLEEYRKNQRDKVHRERINENRKNTIFTMDDLKQKLIEEKREKLGQLCLKYTNEFRTNENKPVLKWEEKILAICQSHSQSMGLGRVKLGHSGFSQRVKLIKEKVSFSNAGENVAYCDDLELDELARKVVQGWIKSPGHRKNLLGDYTHCTIGLFKTFADRWYFTQILIKS